MKTAYMAQKDSELYLSVTRGEWDTARNLIKNGADPDIKSNPDILFFSTNHNNYSFANELLEAEYSKRKQEPSLMVYVGLNHAVFNSITLTFFDHNLGVGYAIHPAAGYAMPINKQGLIHSINCFDAAFGFRISKDLTQIYDHCEGYKLLEKQYSVWGNNCADMAKYMLNDIIKNDLLTCDFYMALVPPIPSCLQPNSNPTHVFKQIYSNLKEQGVEILFDKYTSYYTRRLGYGDFVPYYYMCSRPETKSDCTDEIEAMETKLTLGLRDTKKSNYGALTIV